MTKRINKSVPNKLYWLIGEVADHLGIEPYQIRYWEERIPELSPTRIKGRRRYYDSKQIEMIKNLKSLILDQGLKVSAARLKLKELPAQDKDKEPESRVSEAVDVLEGLLTRLASSLSISGSSEVKDGA